MKPEPIYKALKSLDAIPFSKADGLTKVKKIFTGDIKRKKRTVLLSPRGRQFDQRMAEQWSKLDELILICGRYQGIDARVDKFIDEKISVGPYILSGGELAAMIIMESVARLMPGYLGNNKSLENETVTIGDHKKIECPQYTRPEIIKNDGKNYKVPQILLSGDHKKIEKWKEKHSKRVINK